MGVAQRAELAESPAPVTGSGHRLRSPAPVTGGNSRGGVLLEKSPPAAERRAAAMRRWLPGGGRTAAGDGGSGKRWSNMVARGAEIKGVHRRSRSVLAQPTDDLSPILARTNSASARIPDSLRSRQQASRLRQLQLTDSSRPQPQFVRDPIAVS
ncbi:hypothetical protein F2Q69_00013390 [Brassica cretica]|uniref:Uncharacterized protein n=1 Tax=Brassica cretica TaxID=69181 RepID=A0A8S9R895_BRACR|nr:hypothetical protein F2Q69_00013390 [Brassica cretica]